jgi:tetratricopeptide (TPR) repeat protein
LVVGGFLVLLVGTTNPVAPVDATMLEILAAGEDSEWASGWKSGLIRRAAGPEADNPADGLQRLENASRMRAMLPMVRDGVVFLLLALGGLAVGIFWKKASRATPWTALFLLTCWLALSAWNRPSWAIPGFAATGTTDLPRQFIAAHSLALESAGDAPVWMSPAALRWLPQVGIPTADLDRKTIVQEAGNAILWRAGAAENNSGAALLLGSVSEYRPLLEYLLEVPGWKLVSIEPASLVFVRQENAAGKSPQTPQADTADIEERFPDASARASYLAHLATMFTEIGRNGEARRMFRRALDLEGSRPDVRSLHASFLARRGQWEEAVFEAREVVKENPRFVPAWQVLVQAELAAERPEAAWLAAKALLQLQPGDPYALFLHARAANAAGASFAETDSLRKLIRLTAQTGLSTTTYQVFLGKALAKQGLIDQSRREFQAALAAGDLTTDEEEQVNEFLRKLDEAEGG